MKARVIVVTLVVVCMGMVVPMVSENAEAEGTTVHYSDAGLDGYILSNDAVWENALAGTGVGLIALTSDNSILIGQELRGSTFSYQRGYLSFNTSSIQPFERIVTAYLNIRHISSFTSGLGDFDLQIWNVDYSTGLDIGDWGATGAFEGNIWNTSTVNPSSWYDMGVSTSTINTTGFTQYKLNVSWEGSKPSLGIDQSQINMGGSGFPPYLIIQTVTESEAIITYNFTQQAKIPTDAMVEYWDEHIVAQLDTGFEDGVFGPAWTTFGTPVVTASYSPYEGIYHAGASISESGAGNHTFEAAIDGTGLYNLTLSYYRKVQDVGGGTVSFIADWWNGTAWNELENLTTSAIYELSTWVLNSSADNNPNLIFRFNVTITAGAINNGAWIDNPTLISRSGFHEHSNTTIYVSEFTPWNQTHEQIRYEICAMFEHVTTDSWIHLHVNEDFTYQSVNPVPINVTYLGAGGYNLTEIEHYEIFYSFWFTKPKDGGIGTNYSTNIYPVEIIDWGTQDLYRYEFWNMNQSWLHLEMPDLNFTYLSVNPYADITQLDATTYNITNTQASECMYWIWFTHNKSAKCYAHISLYRELIGIGIPWGTWDVYINNGTWTDTGNQTQVTNPDMILTLGSTYTLTIYDYFPTPNTITNHTFIASDTIISVKVDIPISPLNLNSFRSDTTAFRIWYNLALGANPFQDHVPGGQWYQMQIRGNRSYMIAFDYMDTPLNGSATITNTYFINITVNSSLAYTINIGVDQLTIIVTDINGLEIDVNTLIFQTSPGVVKDSYNLPVEPVDGTRAALPVTTDEYILRHPFVVVEADVRIEFLGVTTADFWDPRPSTGSTTFPRDILHISAPFDTNIMLNYTNGTNFANLTTIPAEIDITQYGVENFTYWSNHTTNILRTVTFRSNAVFYWHYESWINHYYVTLQLNNTTPFDWLDVYWAVHFYVDPDSKPDIFSLTIYDNDNDDTVEIFEVKTSGVRMRFDWINSTVERTFSFSYYELNATQTKDDARIFIREYTIREHHGRDYWMGAGRWENPYTGDYDGKIWIVLENLAGDGDVLSSSVEVYDENGDSMTGHFVVLDETIQIFEDGVGTMGVGEERLYTVYFQYKTMGGTTFPLFTPLITLGTDGFRISLYIVMFVVIILFFVLGLFIDREQTQKLWFVFSLLCLFLWMVGGGVCWALGVT